ncbi:hypothetical protein [Oscillatoria acuminata]|uniref:Uncharacterized protein n=1 Tax=Oscillatoria acuminata PCC 6304 TaxID=56110 RepID=K9TRL5_9CYAN|nr:hypothetical protein [Oscillatoria acuminata]AFY85487.1 hypothetical protein Oscil6304_6027 [Oscillatoria acuminata PCC 6304]
MPNFPSKLKPFISLNDLDYADLIDLLIAATEAAKDCHQSGIKTRTVQNALEDSDTTQDNFSGIQESEEFLALTLTEEEWIDVIQSVSSRMSEFFTPF